MCLFIGPNIGGRGLSKNRNTWKLMIVSCVLAPSYENPLEDVNALMLPDAWARQVRMWVEARENSL